MTERVADFVVRKINEAGVEHIFMLTGRGILYLSDAVAKNENLTHISTLHEQGAAYAAMAYAKLRGISASLLSTGCGATNAISACLCAYQDNLPCVFISGNHILKETTHFTGRQIRTFGQQEADIIKIVSSITKYAVMITDAKDVAYHIEKALFLAQSARMGPVWIDIPLDIQNEKINEKELQHFLESNKKENINQKDFDLFLKAFLESKRALIFVGGGAKEAKVAVRNFVETHKIPLVSSQSGCDIYGSGNELSIGVVGAIGCSRAGNFALQNADFLLVLGSKLCSQTIGDNHLDFARNAKKFIVDIDKNEHIDSNFDGVFNCDVSDFLELLNKQNVKFKNDEWVKKCLHWKEIFDIKNEKFIQKSESSLVDLYYLADILSSKIKDEATIIVDSGLEELIIPSTIKFKKSHCCLFPAAQGAMGYALPAILGAYFGGKRDIIAIIGDGSIMMNIQELLVIKHHNINAKIIVINNDMYAVIRNRQKDLFRNRTIGNDPSDGVPAPDFEKIAFSYGIAYLCAKNISEFDSKIDEFLNANTLTIFEVFSNPNQKYLHASYGFDNNKRLVKKPLEDLSPFIDGELISKEMYKE